MRRLNTLALAHTFLAENIAAGSFCIDATAGRGNDTAFLCELVGEEGKVLAFDIQQAALDSTNALLAAKGYQGRAQVILDSHANLASYAAPGTVDAIVFNFGYLPGGDHRIYTQPESSIAAIAQSLLLLKEHGVLCLCIYYGGDTGYQERDALLAYLQTIDPKRYTVLTNQFYNRPNDPPIAAFIFKDV